MSFHYSGPQAAGADALSAAPMQSHPFPSFFLVFSMLSEQLLGLDTAQGQHLRTVPAGAAVPLGGSRANAPLSGCPPGARRDAQPGHPCASRASLTTG